MRATASRWGKRLNPTGVKSRVVPLLLLVMTAAAASVVFAQPPRDIAVQATLSDWYAPDYYKQSPARSPKGPAQGRTRVIRGGSWTETRARQDLSSDFRHQTFGFRCAKSE